MWEQIRSNQRKTAILIIVMAAILFLMGYLLGEVMAPGGGLAGLFIAFIIWMFLTLISYFSGDSIFLALSHAKKIEKKDHPILFNVVEEMTIAASLPKMPDVYIIDEAAPNAFATGRKPEKAAVAVTAGLLERLSRDELQGVIAHEIGHIKNRDVLYMIMVGVMMGTIVLLADIGLRTLFWTGGGRRRTSNSNGGGQGQAVILIIAVVLMILAPILAQFMYLAISRRREYLADASGALFTRYPEGLASALEKISSSPEKLKSATRTNAAFYIVNPLKFTNSDKKTKKNNKKQKLSDLSSTHPPLSERIRILRSMGGGAGYLDYESAYKKITGKAVGVVPAGSLAQAKKIESQKPQKKDSRSGLDRLRETTNMLWQLNQFIFIACTCGVKLKIPPEYKNNKIQCPHCGNDHTAAMAGH